MSEFDVNGYNTHECDIHNHGYYLGAQSQQAKIDELQKKIDCCREENKAHLEKIDGVLKILKDWDDQSYRDDMDQLTGEIEDILKGNKDEN